MSQGLECIVSCSSHYKRPGKATSSSTNMSQLLYLYSMIQDYYSENGHDFCYSGVTHILLFNCFTCTSSSDNKASINSSIITCFKDMLVDTHREKLVGKCKDVNIHIIVSSLKLLF